MVTNEAEKKHIDALAAMSTARVICTLVESMAAGMNRYKLDLAELEKRFEAFDKDAKK